MPYLISNIGYNVIVKVKNIGDYNCEYHNERGKIIDGGGVQAWIPLTLSHILNGKYYPQSLPYVKEFLEVT